MEIKWHGHACFEIRSSDGKIVVTDPFDESVGYPLPDVRADVVLTSHDHYDHNNVGCIKGSPSVVRGEGEHVIDGIKFRGIHTFHDTSSGSERGENIVFVFEIDGIRLCHLGDLGHVLDEKKVKEIGEIDILFVPVGGVYTIDAKGAEKVIEQLNPRIVIPMHFKTPPLKLPVRSVDDFLKGKENVTRKKTLSIKKEDLPEEQQIIVLDYE
ncbi:MAG: MBL fold metallo-hydrolase [Candidatus Syntropharchaeia archaeon]